MLAASAEALERPEEVRDHRFRFVPAVRRHGVPQAPGRVRIRATPLPGVIGSPAATESAAVAPSPPPPPAADAEPLLAARRTALRDRKAQAEDRREQRLHRAIFPHRRRGHSPPSDDGAPPARIYVPLEHGSKGGGSG